jgi:hypothetical protein
VNGKAKSIVFNCEQTEFLWLRTVRHKRCE